MDTLWAILAVVLAIIGSIGCVIPALPGVLLTYIGYLCLYFVDGVTVPLTWSIVFGILTLFVTILDYVLPAYMTKRFGGTKAGEWGATIGVFVGMFLGPIGLICGPFLGAFIGELIHDSNDKKRAFKSGLGSFLSFFVGTLINLVISIWMTVNIIVDVWKFIF